MVEVFAIQLMDEADFMAIKEHLFDLLPDENTEFYSRFKRHSSMQRSLLGDLLARYILSQRLNKSIKTIRFAKSKNGKPFLKNTHYRFNISHSADHIVMALDQHNVGIDIELIRPVNFRIAERFFSPPEVLVLNSFEGNRKLEYFFDLWTLKESYLKFIGTGLTLSLSSFVIENNNNEFTMRSDSQKKKNNIFFRQYDIGKTYKLSVCSSRNEFKDQIEWVSVTDILKNNHHGN